MFSMTVMTSGTSVCAMLMAFAIDAYDSSRVQAPTVDPGLNSQCSVSLDDAKTHCQLYSFSPS